MSLSQQPFAKHQGINEGVNAYTAKQVLANESLVAKNQQLAMYVLMERAGKAAFEQLVHSWPNAQNILVIAGKGNNGGDGFILARLAHQAKLKVTVLLTGEPKDIKGDALTAYQAMLDVDVSRVFSDNLLTHISQFVGDVIIDALFGIGFYGTLNEPMQALVLQINQHKASVLSVDVPSGLCATTGSVSQETAVVSDVTITYIVYKQGLLTGQAANYVGTLVLAEIGLGSAFKDFLTTNVTYQSDSPLLSEEAVLQKRLNTSHKGSIGQVLTVGGGKGMPGAIRLASEASLRCGAALVSVSCFQDNQTLVFNGRPELMMAPNTAEELECSAALKNAKVLLLGPGLGQTSWSKSLFDIIINELTNQISKWLILDADGLTLLSKKQHYCDRWVLTPHPKEAARLLGCDVATIEADRFNAVKSIAKQYGGICVLKGAGSLISDGTKVVINSTGNAGMASGGMGDVLSGVVAGLILQGKDYFLAVCSAVYIHGAAGDIIAKNNGQRGMLASDLFTPLQKLVNLEHK